MIKYYIVIMIIIFTLFSCTYFDPMHGLTILEYGETYSLTFDGESEILFEYGRWAYNNVAVHDDNVYVVYDNTIDNCLILIRSQDGGSTWSDAVITPAGNCSLVCMTEVDGVLYISYTQSDALHCIVSYDGGDSIRLTDIGAVEYPSGDSYTGITGYGDNIFISYCNEFDSDANLHEIMCAYSFDGGLTFSTVVVDSTINGSSGASSVAYNPLSERVHISYLGEYEELSHAMASITDIDNWTTTTINNTLGYQSSRILVGEDGTIHLCYSGTNYQSSTDDGDTWSSIEDINPSISNAVDVSLAEQDGTVYAAYYNYDDKELEVAIGPESWSTQIIDEDSSSGAVSGRLCSIDISGTVVFVSYVDDGENISDEDDNRLRLAKSTDSGLNWN